MGTEIISLVNGGLKQTGPEVNHSHSFNTEVRNEWSCTSAGTVCLHRMERNTVAFLNVNISVIHNAYLSHIHLVVVVVECYM